MARKKPSWHKKRKRSGRVVTEVIIPQNEKGEFVYRNEDLEKLSAHPCTEITITQNESGDLVYQIVEFEPPVEQAIPPTLIRKLLQADLGKLDDLELTAKAGSFIANNSDNWKEIFLAQGVNPRQKLSKAIFFFEIDNPPDKSEGPRCRAQHKKLYGVLKKLYPKGADPQKIFDCIYFDFTHLNELNRTQESLRYWIKNLRSASDLLSKMKRSSTYLSLTEDGKQEMEKPLLKRIEAYKSFIDGCRKLINSKKELGFDKKLSTACRKQGFWKDIIFETVEYLLPRSNRFGRPVLTDAVNLTAELLHAFYPSIWPEPKKTVKVVDQRYRAKRYLNPPNK